MLSAAAFLFVLQQKAKNRQYGREHGHKPYGTRLLLVSQFTGQQSGKLARQGWR